MRSPLTSLRVSPFHLLVLACATVIAGTLAPARAHAEGVWQQLLVPGPRTALSAIRESATGRLIVFSQGQVWALAPGPSSVWTQLQPTGGGPGSRGGCSVIYDSPRDRLIVFGGQAKTTRSNEAWALSLAEPPAWTLLAPTGTPPTGRTGHSAIYDPPRQRMIVFGGNDGSVRNEVWSLTLSGTPAWSQLSPSGLGPPVARELHSAVYLSSGQAMLIFGGRNSAGTPRNDTWALSLSGTVAWGTPSGLIGPATRYGHSAVMDPDGTRMLVYGGTGAAGTPLGDVQSLHFSPSYAWAEITPSQPPPAARTRHASVADPGTGTMVLIGGTGASGAALGDVWAMRFVSPSWARWWVEENSVLPRRSGHSAVLDAARQRILVFGGIHYKYPTDSAYNDVWAFSLGAMPGWTRLTPAGTPPAPRAFHTAIMDPVRDRMIVHGGNCYSPIGWYLTDDVWQLSLSGTPTWSAITTGGSNNPWPAMRERAVYDPVGDRMWVHGGDDIWTTREFVWNLPLSGTPNWSLLETPGSAPAFRRGHTAVYDPENRRMLVFGGLTDGYDHDGNPVKVPLDDAWRFRADVADTAWIEVGPAGAPPGPALAARGRRRRAEEPHAGVRRHGLGRRAHGGRGRPAAAFARAAGLADAGPDRGPSTGALRPHPGLRPGE